MRNPIWLKLAMTAVIAVVVSGCTPRDNHVVATAGSGISADRKATMADADAFIAPYRAQLDATQRPVVRIDLEPMSSDDLRVSKVGGRAYWSRGQNYPTGKDGRPLFLLAQIDFAEVPPTQGYPARGLLQFFIADNDLYGANLSGDFSVAALSVQRDFRVVYWPDTDADPTLLPLPQFKLLPHDPGKPRRMRFSADTEALSTSDRRFDALLGGDAYHAAEAYAQAHGIDADQLFDAVWERFSGSGHKLGGYPYFTQDDPRPDGALELLFQLDSDDEMMWGDVGVGGFFIAPDDFAKGDFSRVMYSWDCS